MILKSKIHKLLIASGLISILFAGLNIGLSAPENAIGPLQLKLIGAWEQLYDGKDIWSKKDKIVLMFRPNGKFDFTYYTGIIMKREFTSEYNVDEEKRILTLEQRETRIKPHPLDQDLALMERHQEWIGYRIVHLKDKNLMLKIISKRGKNFEGEYKKVR